VSLQNLPLTVATMQTFKSKPMPFLTIQKLQDGTKAWSQTNSFSKASCPEHGVTFVTLPPNSTFQIQTKLNLMVEMLQPPPNKRKHRTKMKSNSNPNQNTAGDNR